MTDAGMIEKEQAKLDKALLTDLKRVQSTGWLRSKYKTETLLINGLIVFSSPRPGFIYNHYKLTEQGLARLAELIVPRRNMTDTIALSNY